jgi:hypothetical protein
LFFGLRDAAWHRQHPERCYDREGEGTMIHVSIES